MGEWVPREEISESTGIAFMEINTLYQLLGLRSRGTAALEAARLRSVDRAGMPPGLG